MQSKRIQNKIAESRWTSSIVFPLALIVWAIAALHNTAVIFPLVLTAIAALFMVEINNGNGLIRIYSRMVSCSFIVLATLNAYLFSSIEVGVTFFCMAGFFLCIFRSYQQHHCPGNFFYAFACIGIISLFWIQILYYLPILWILIVSNILAFSAKNFTASLIGLLCPYWFFAAYLGITNHLDWLVNHFRGIYQFAEPFNMTGIHPFELITLGFVLLCAITALVHTFRQIKSDSIKTRLLLQTFITLDIASIIFLVLQPQHYPVLQSIIIICTAPLLGHFFALTRTKFTNWLFILLSLTGTVITLLNLWIALQTF